MCYYNKLGILRQLLKIRSEPSHVGIVKSRLDLVQKAKGRRFQILDGKQKGDRGKRLLPSGKLHHILKFLARRLRDDFDSGLQDILVLGELQGSFSASEQLFKRLVEFPLYIPEFLRKLLTHPLVQLLNDVFQRLFRLHQVVVLAGEEGMAFQKIFIIFNRIYIYGTEFPDLILDGGNFFLHSLDVCEVFIPVFQRAVWRDLIFLPHIGDLSFSLLFCFFRLAFQTETFFIQKGNLFGKLVSFLKERFVAQISLFFFLLPLFSLCRIFSLFLPAVFNGLSERVDTVFFLSGVLPAVLKAFGQLVALFLRVLCF